MRDPKTVLLRLACVVGILTGTALAQAPEAAEAPPWTEAPVRVDPATCTPMRSGVYLPLGSEQIAVIGVGDEAACIVELFAEMEGGYHQALCRFRSDAEPFAWDPFARQKREPAEAWGAFVRRHCETVATGNFLMPGAEPVVFPRTPWSSPRSDEDPASDAP